MAKCLISLGANLGDRGATLQSALQQLATVTQTSFLAQSSFRETKPAGGPQQAAYLNAAAKLETTLSPQQLLTELQRIENELGRVRTEHWGPRTIDLDLLLYDHLELETPELTLPHPRMSFRRFVLEPAAEIAAEMVYPINGWKIGKLLGNLQPWNRVVLLRSQDSSRKKLLVTVAQQENVRVYEPPQIRPLEMNPLAITQRAIDRLNKKNIHVEQSDVEFRRWIISADSFQVSIPQQAKTLATKHAQIPPALVVVWQTEVKKLESLDRVRRQSTSGPHLWIPGVSLEQARQEVIAAMAAME